MPEQPILFSERAAKRITTAVSSWERQFVNGTSRFRRQPPVLQAVPGIWARITNHDYANARYAWTMVELQDDGSWDDVAVSGTTSDDFAIEVNGFAFTPSNSRVWMLSHYDFRIFQSPYSYTFRGVTAGTIAKGFAGSVTVYTYADANTGHSITAMNRSRDIDNGKDVYCEMIGPNTFEIIEAEC